MTVAVVTGAVPGGASGRACVVMATLTQKQRQVAASSPRQPTPVLLAPHPTPTLQPPLWGTSSETGEGWVRPQSGWMNSFTHPITCWKGGDALLSHLPGCWVPRLPPTFRTPIFPFICL